MPTGTYRFGMVGLGVMGRNMLLNMADHGFSVAGFDTDPAKGQALLQEGAGKDVYAATSMADMVAHLATPRVVMMLVPAGPPVDAVIKSLLPLLAKGDLIIDGGNSYYKDTDLRQQALQAQGLHFFGMGVSGGESGARHGPSMMPGGDPEAYKHMQPILEAIAAKVNGEPCVAYLGPRSAGNYVKTVHNGIEYAIIQLIGETYDLMKRGLGLNDDEIHDTFKAWNDSELGCFLLEITVTIFKQVDPKTGKRLIDVILDAARQKGTGMWTSQDAMSLHYPIPTIDASVAQRDISGLEEERHAAAKVLTGPTGRYGGDRKALLEQARNALYAGMIIAYAQGLGVLARASKEYGYGLDLETVARIWRGGCIIRAKLLETFRQAFRANPALPNLLVAPQLAGVVSQRVGDLRAVAKTLIDLGLPAPALASALAYYDSYRSAWLPTNLTQAQRDFFGAHTYERIDTVGKFHTRWGE